MFPCKLLVIYTHAMHLEIETFVKYFVVVLVHANTADSEGDDHVGVLMKCIMRNGPTTSATFRT